MSQHRRVVANIALSLDGRTHGPDGDGDMSWIVPHAVSDAARDHMAAYVDRSTTALMGRKNYEGFAGFWPAVAQMPEADERDRAFSRWFTEVEKVVFSHAADLPLLPSTEMLAEDPVVVVQRLRGQTGGDLVVLASGSVIRPLLAAGLVDELSLTLCPEIAGGGARLFDEGLPASSWVLVSSIASESGALCLRYQKTPVA